MKNDKKIWHFYCSNEEENQHWTRAIQNRIMTLKYLQDSESHGIQADGRIIEVKTQRFLFELIAFSFY